MALTDALRTKIRAQVEAVGGRHDEIEVYGGPDGDPGLTPGPGSISWEINGDLGSVSAAGMAAVIMEVLHPSVMAGVSQQSTFRTEPLQRARNTLGYVLRTTFGSTEAATAIIEHVKHVHGFVEGTRPDGQPYRALDPELIAWVHTCIPWAIMEAFHRYHRPLTTAERDAYLREQAPIGIMGGAEWVPTSMAELDAYVERMRPMMAMTEQTREFIDFLVGRQRRRVPRHRPSAARAPARHLGLDAADADLGTPPHGHLPAEGGRAGVPRPERPPPGPPPALGLPRAAVPAAGHGPRAGPVRIRDRRRRAQRQVSDARWAPPSPQPQWLTHQRSCSSWMTSAACDAIVATSSSARNCNGSGLASTRVRR